MSIEMQYLELRKKLRRSMNISKQCEVCGTSEGRIRGKLGKYKKYMCDKCYYVAQTQEIGRKCTDCGETNGRIYTKINKFGRSLCGKCYTLALKELGTGKSCEICGDTDGYIHGKSGKHRMDLCSKHSAQMDKYGKAMDRTRYEPNGVNVCDGYAEIILYDFYSNEVARTMVNLEDVEKAITKKWYLNKETGYVQCNTLDFGVTLHRFIMDNPVDMTVDHHNGIKTDNRRCNLRIATNSQNNMNRAVQSNNTSGYTGVRKCGNNKWQAYIKINRKTINLGVFSDINDAAESRRQAEIKYFGEFAYQRRIA